MTYNIPVIDTYIHDLEEAVEYAKANPTAIAQGQAAIYGLMARIPMRGMVDKNVRNVMMGLYGEGSSEENGGDELEAGEVTGSPAWMGLLNRALRFFGR
jgi:hypothetical protein